MCFSANDTHAVLVKTSRKCVFTNSTYESSGRKSYVFLDLCSAILRVPKISFCRGLKGRRPEGPQRFKKRGERKEEEREREGGKKGGRDVLLE